MISIYEFNMDLFFKEMGGGACVYWRGVLVRRNMVHVIATSYPLWIWKSLWRHPPKIWNTKIKNYFKVHVEHLNILYERERHYFNMKFTFILKKWYLTTVPYDPEGILGTFTSVLICFLGLQVSKHTLTSGYRVFRELLPTECASLQ